MPDRAAAPAGRVPGRRRGDPARSDGPGPVSRRAPTAGRHAQRAYACRSSGTLGFEKAEVTSGGVALDEIDPKTLESRLVPGLHFAGEILDLDGLIGGYNFQAAWSTGWLAGESAAVSSVKSIEWSSLNSLPNFPASGWPGQSEAGPGICRRSQPGHASLLPRPHASCLAMVARDLPERQIADERVLQAWSFRICSALVDGWIAVFSRCSVMESRARLTGGMSRGLKVVLVQSGVHHRDRIEHTEDVDRTAVGRPRVDQARHFANWATVGPSRWCWSPGRRPGRKPADSRRASPARSPGCSRASAVTVGAAGDRVVIALRQAVEGLLGIGRA